jgi:hypothetical protein
MVGAAQARLLVCLTGWRNLMALEALASDDYFGRRGTSWRQCYRRCTTPSSRQALRRTRREGAAEAMAAYDGHFNRIENNLGTMRGEIKNDLAVMRGDMNVMRADINNDLVFIRGDINLLKWMNGITWALCFGILFKLFLR